VVVFLVEYREFYRQDRERTLRDFSFASYSFLDDYFEKRLEKEKKNENLSWRIKYLQEIALEHTRVDFSPENVSEKVESLIRGENEMIFVLIERELEWIYFSRKKDLRNNKSRY
jgi:hypothetical protein